MLTLYYCNITSFRNLTGYDLLTPERQTKLNQYKQFSDQVRCLVAGLLLRHALGDELAASLTIDSNGKPQLTDSSIHFNLSHSGNYVILGVSDHIIGVDIEVNAPYSPSVARKCFTLEEQTWLLSNPNNNIQPFSDAFFKLWTGKESIMKAIGQGFRLPPESFQVLPITNSFHKILNHVWYMQWTAIDTHTVCVVTSHKEEMSLIELTREVLLYQ